eukprot:gnl/Spiro4/6792_TR3510_c0_g1_i1.p1 gnl/Spiro4/6792_TR3510_c0_g1~~gnl/Spiro4/6792_TR3510_c0_g1_i1.p1  ORF type:complete len:504 (-),score=155.42 gnl/Spiro4/6792_TR3510_c0_g1_i1:193-1704(-)
MAFNFPIDTADTFVKVIDTMHRLSESDVNPDELAVCVLDLGSVVRQHRLWTQSFARVQPFYAVKCNPDPLVIRLLAALGSCFDCASRAEIELVLSLGVTADKIIFANPCKQEAMIRFAASVGVHLMTFDNAAELQKVSKADPHARMVLRIITDDSRSMCALSSKFGAPLEVVESLLHEAKRLRVHVVGVSFHVESGATVPHVFADAVRDARQVFSIAAELGMRLSLVDIGGGFPDMYSEHGLQFPAVVEVLRPALDECFPPDLGVRIIGEPGRFFVGGAYTLAVAVTSRRLLYPHLQPRLNVPARPAWRDLPPLVPRSPSLQSSGPSSPTTPTAPLSPSLSPSLLGRALSRGDKPECSDATRATLEPTGIMYYVTDGVYSSFNNVLTDHAVLTPKLLVCRGQRVHPARASSFANQGTVFPCSIFGPTCDALDCITKTAELPELWIHDWIYFENMGAYTFALSCTFNGFGRPLRGIINTESSSVPTPELPPPLTVVDGVVVQQP